VKNKALLFSLLLLLVTFSVSLPAQELVPTDHDWKWLSGNFGAAFDHAMPLQKTKDVVVSYRLRETLQIGQPEYSFTIIQGMTPASLSVHVRTPQKDPVGKQLLILRRRFPLESIAALGKKLRFVDWELTEQQCPELKDAVQRLRATPVSFQLDNTIMVTDPTVHELFIDSSRGSVLATLVDPDSAPVKWALETRKMIQACRTDKSASARLP